MQMILITDQQGPMLRRKHCKLAEHKLLICLLFPKAAIIVIICPFNALIDSHILELKETRVSSKKLVKRENLTADH